MERNAKESSGGGGGGGGGEAKSSNNNNNDDEGEENPSSNNSSDATLESGSSLCRTPFTNLSQVDADLALARTLQEQERAYLMLRMNGEGTTTHYATSHQAAIASSFYIQDDDDDDDDDDGYNDFDHHHDADDDDDDDDDEDAFDVHQNLELDLQEEDDHLVDLDPSAFSSDEAFARALQDAEHRELAARMMALTAANHWDVHDTEDNDTNSQDTWEEVDPDELSYEELLALGEVVGTESRGLSADGIASLPSINYKAQHSPDGSTEQCVICRLEYEDEDTLTVLSCKHTYHSECINNWLQINKVCPVCSAEVSTSENR